MAIPTTKKIDKKRFNLAKDPLTANGGTPSVRRARLRADRLRDKGFNVRVVPIKTMSGKRFFTFIRK